MANSGGTMIQFGHLTTELILLFTEVFNWRSRSEDRRMLEIFMQINKIPGQVRSRDYRRHLDI